MLSAKGKKFLRPALIVVVAGVLLSAMPSAGRYFLQNPIRSDPAPQLDTMARWINSLDAEGRVHVETFSSFRRETAPIPWNEQMARISVQLPTRTKVPLLGGYYSGFFTGFNAVNFFSGEWMGKKLSEWTEKGLSDALKRYHVSYLLTWSEEAGEGLARFPGVVEQMEAPPPFSGWRVLSPGDWFLEGSGRLASYGYDRLEFDGVESQATRAVVSFHWAPTLSADGAEIVPVDVAGSTMPFIGLVDPSDKVTITNESAW